MSNSDEEEFFGANEDGDNDDDYSEDNSDDLYSEHNAFETVEDSEANSAEEKVDNIDTENVDTNAERPSSSTSQQPNDDVTSTSPVQKASNEGMKPAENESESVDTADGDTENTTAKPEVNFGADDATAETLTNNANSELASVKAAENEEHDNAVTPSPTTNEEQEQNQHNGSDGDGKHVNETSSDRDSTPLTPRDSSTTENITENDKSATSNDSTPPRPEARDNDERKQPTSLQDNPDSIDTTDNTESNPPVASNTGMDEDEADTNATNQSQPTIAATAAGDKSAGDDDVGSDTNATPQEVVDDETTTHVDVSHRRSSLSGAQEWRCHPQHHEACTKGDFVRYFGNDAIEQWKNAQQMRPDGHGVLMTQTEFLEEHGETEGMGLWENAPSKFDPTLGSGRSATLEQDAESHKDTDNDSEPDDYADEFTDDDQDEAGLDENNDQNDKSRNKSDDHSAAQVEKHDESDSENEDEIFDEVDAREKAFREQFRDGDVNEVTESERKSAASPKVDNHSNSDVEEPDDVDEPDDDAAADDDDDDHSYGEDDFDDDEDQPHQHHDQQIDEDEAHQQREKEKQDEERRRQEKEAKEQAEKEKEKQRLHDEQAKRQREEEDLQRAQREQERQKRAAEEEMRRLEEEHTRAAIEEAKDEERSLDARLVEIHEQKDAVLSAAEEKKQQNEASYDLSDIRKQLKHVNGRERKLAIELRKLQDKNRQLLKEIQMLPDNVDDPKALRDRNNFLRSVLRPLVAENQSLMNVHQIQTEAFTSVELETNAYRVEAGKLKSKINELKDQLAATRESEASRIRLSREIKAKAGHKELRRIQEENNFLATNLRLLRENVRQHSGPRSKNTAKKTPKAAKHKRAIRAAKLHSNNGGHSSASESDDDSYASDDFPDDDGQAPAVNGMVGMSPAARQRALSILGARLRSADNKKISPIRRNGPRTKGGKNLKSQSTKNKRQPPHRPTAPHLDEDTIDQLEEKLLRKRAAITEAYRVYHKRTAKELKEIVSKRYTLDEKLTTLQKELDAVNASTAKALEKKYKLSARVQRLKAAMNGQPLPVFEPWPGDVKDEDKAEQPSTEKPAWRLIQEQDERRRQEIELKQKAEQEEQAAAKKLKEYRLAHTGRDADIYTKARYKINAAAYAMGGVQLELLFKRVDVDSSGYLDNGEFYRVIRHQLRLSSAEVPDDLVQDLFDHIDIADGSKEGGNGQISLDELRRFMTEEGFDEYSETQKEWVAQERADERESKRLAKLKLGKQQELK